MPSVSVSHTSPPKQAEFEIRFIWWALGMAIFAGFALGAHVASVIGFNFPLGKGFISYIQTHGHLQLMGWVGLFIISISLHFIPRLAGTPLAHPARIGGVLWLISLGLMIRFTCHSFLPYLSNGALFAPVSYLVALSGLLEWLGVVLYLTLMLQTIKRVGGSAQKTALKSVRPFFAMMLTGWLLYPSIHFALLVRMVFSKAFVLSQPWNEFAIQLFISLVLLPVAFAFSIRMFPLYLRLPAIDWSVRGVALTYLMAIVLYLLPTLPPVAALPSGVPLLLSSIGLMARGGVIVWFVWKLDLFTRRRAPWTMTRILQPGADRRPTREGLPDYGEFGRFERLLYSAYAWLLFGAIIEILLGASILFGWTLPISSDAVRHIYLLGFITQLIFGMAVRVIPGFIKKKRVALPDLVDMTFWLGNIATVSRVFPLILPLFLFETFPVMVFPVQTLFAFSGVFGLAAIICLAVNLTKTAKLPTGLIKAQDRPHRNMI